MLTGEYLADLQIHRTERYHVNLNASGLD